MILFPIQKLLTIPVVLITLGVLTFGFVCMGMANHASMHSMGIDSAGMTISAIDQQECCNTNISKNINSWKNVILTVPDKMRDTLALLALGFISILGYSWVSLWNRDPLVEADTGQLRLYIRQNPDLIFFNHLKLAFARGILNPKIY